MILSVLIKEVLPSTYYGVYVDVCVGIVSTSASLALSLEDKKYFSDGATVVKPQKHRRSYGNRTEQHMHRTSVVRFCG